MKQTLNLFKKWIYKIIKSFLCLLLWPKGRLSRPYLCHTYCQGTIECWAHDSIGSTKKYSAPSLILSQINHTKHTRMITTLSFSSRDPSFPNGDTLRGDDEDVGSVGAHAPPLHHLLPLLPHCHLIPVIRVRTLVPYHTSYCILLNLLNWLLVILNLRTFAPSQLSNTFTEHF